MINKIIPMKPAALKEGKPVSARAAASQFRDGRIVGYISGNTLAMLSRIASIGPHGMGCKCRSSRKQYGFVYLTAPNTDPPFMTDSALRSIEAANCYQGNRQLYVCSDVAELVTLFHNRNKS